MAKRRNAWSDKIYHRYLREGRGKGDLADYNPWLHTRDFPSSGNVTRIKGVVTGRIHHLMSRLELLCFLYLESLPGIEDIKEQFPLPLAETQLIAASLKIRHPEVNGYPYVMTTDFYYRCDGQWFAVQVKQTSSLEESRVQEKFKIEKVYWAKQMQKCDIEVKEAWRLIRKAMAAYPDETDIAKLMDYVETLLRQEQTASGDTPV